MNINLSSDESNNISGDIVGRDKIVSHTEIHGLTYEDARRVALDVFDANFPRLVGLAAELVQERAHKFVDKLISEFPRENPKMIETIATPEMQYAILSAQSVYAKSGSEVILDILVGLLVEKATTNTSSFLSNLLNEALEVGPKLLTEQINLLSAVFFVGYASHEEKAYDIREFVNLFEGELFPCIVNLPISNPQYLYLRDVGCLTITHFDPSYERADRESIELSPSFKKLVELNLNKAGWTSDEAHFLIQTKRARFSDFKEKHNNPDELETSLYYNNNHISLFESLEKLFPETGNLYEKLLLHAYEHNFFGALQPRRTQIELTSLGIVIANANLRRVADKIYNIGEWVS